MVNDGARNLRFVASGDRMIADSIDDDYLIVIRANGRCCQIGDDHRNSLVLTLFASVFDDILAFSGKSHTERRGRQGGYSGENIDRWLQRQHQIVSRFFHFVHLWLGRCVVGHRGHRKKQISLCDVAHHGSMHLFGGLHANGAHTRRFGKRGGAADQRDIGASFTKCYGDRITHFARARVGNAAYRIDWLEGGAGGDQRAFASEQFGAGPCRIERFDGFEQGLGFQHATETSFTAGLVTFVRAENDHAIRAQPRHIALRRRVFPHFTIHCRRQHQRTFGGIARDAQRGQQIIAQAIGQFGHEVRTRWRHQNRIDTAREFNMRHVIGNARVP